MLAELANHLKALQEMSFRDYGISPPELESHSSRAITLTQTLIGMGLAPRTPEFAAVFSFHMKNLNEIEKVLPTPYEDANWYSILMRAVKNVERAIPSVYPSYDLNGKSHRVLFGTLRSGNVNGTSVKIDGIDGYLVVIEDGLFLFAHLMAKVLSSAFPIRSTNQEKVKLGYDEESVERHIANNKELAQHFFDVLNAFVVEGHPGKAAVYFLKTEIYRQIATSLTLAFEHFLVAHEYAHLVLGHLDSPNNESTSIGPLTLEEGIRAMGTSWQQEGDADQLGLVLTMECMHEMNLPPFIAYGGAVMVLMCSEVVERFVDILRYGKELGFFYQLADKTPDIRIPSYPSADDRCAAMRNFIRKRYSMYPFKQITDLERGLRSAAEGLFRQIRPKLLKMHKQGIKVTCPWRWDRQPRISIRLTDGEAASSTS